MYYYVSARKGAVVRKGVELQSSIAGIIEPGTRVVAEREATASDGTRRVKVRTEDVEGWVSLRVLDVDKEATKSAEKRETEDRATRARRGRAERDAGELAAFCESCRRLGHRDLDALALAGAQTFTSAAQLLLFWFGRQFYHGPGSPFAAAGDYFQNRMPLWFGGGSRLSTLFDAAQLNAGPLIDAAASGALDGDARWGGPRGALAKLLLLDQFPRVAYRGSPRAFAYDGAACALAASMTRFGKDEASGRWYEETLAPGERFWVCLALSHSEDVGRNASHVALARGLCAGALVPASARDFFEQLPGFPNEHHDCVLKFGRFPQRNKVLGRASTAEERAFLASPTRPAWAAPPRAHAVLYWAGGRGLADPIRFVLALAMRPLVDAPIASKNKFHKFRATGGLPFDAVPVLFDVDAGDALDADAVCRRLEAGDAVAESAAICQHLARRFHLDGADEAERTAAGAVASAVAAARGALVTARFGDDPDKALVAFALGPLKRLLARLERLLGRRARPAFVAGGPTPTYADALVLEVLEYAADECGAEDLDRVAPEFPRLFALRDALRALAPFREYLRSPARAPPPTDAYVRMVCGILGLKIPDYLLDPFTSSLGLPLAPAAARELAASVATKGVAELSPRARNALALNRREPEPEPAPEPETPDTPGAHPEPEAAFPGAAAHPEPEREPDAAAAPEPEPAAAPELDDVMDAPDVPATAPRATPPRRNTAFPSAASPGFSDAGDGSLPPGDAAAPADAKGKGCAQQ